MYFERGGLIVWALVLFTTTCFVLTPGVPTPSDPPDPEQTSKSPQSSTSQVTLPETGDNGGQGNNGDETAETVTASEGPTKHVLEGEEDSNEPLAKKGKTEGMLYYEITKRINERNLTLGDIQEVLSRKDDESLFIYTLADKLGYVVNEEYDDPHIPVIKSKKDKLTTLLETKKARFSTPPAQEADTDSAVSETPPISSEPAAPSDSQKIGYQVIKAIDKLKPEAIDALISDPTFSDTLGYKVGSRLGYSDDNEHMKYLENKNIKELRDLLQQILKSKMPSKQKTPTSDGQGPEGGGEQVHGGRDSNQNDPTQKERDQGRNDIGSSYKDKNLSTATGDSQGDRGDTNRSEDEALSDLQGLPGGDSDLTSNNNSPGEDPVEGHQDPPTAPKVNAGGDSQVQQPSVDSDQGKVPVDENGNNEENLATGKPHDGGIKTEGDVNTPPQTNGENTTSKASKTPQTVNAKGEGEARTPDSKADDNRKNQKQKDQQEANFDDFNVADWEEYVENQREILKSDKNFMAFLKDKYHDLYEQLDTSQDAVEDAIDIYNKLTALDVELTKADNEGVGGGGGSKNTNLEAEAKGGNLPPSPESNDVKGDDIVGSSDDDADGSLSISRSSSSFGTWHFLSIFLVLGLIVVVGYLCTHNRKKIREGVASYINDSSKRRRRAREYKPLIST